MLLRISQKKVNDEEQKTRKSKPYVTYGFILLQALYFIWVFLKDSSLNTYTLVEWGAKFNPLIYEGEWWRFISPIFLHAGLMHIAANCLMIYIVGPWAERLYGKVRYAFILILGGIAGNIASFALNNSVSVGSSTAVFALFGCLLLSRCFKTTFICENNRSEYCCSCCYKSCTRFIYAKC
ncbi:rhomboid family membrane protein [Listeria aquatica FSL S10-1188]|uniref:Rhomboid family membrane protein n=1 Tax=Listeria aquatica FSL S10-1188 TaxID=1265818 RepID=W7AWB0_9LIST|nr:rhomboid family membrane protein [Listeria aquatica FSL S10-1188]